MALELAETLALDHNVPLPPVSPAEVEAAFLRRLKVKRAEIGPPPAASELPAFIQGRPAAAYRVSDILVTLLHGGPDLAYACSTAATGEDGADQKTERPAILLQGHEPRGLVTALPVVNGRPRRGSAVATTPLAEVDLRDGSWLRAIACWAAWLAGVTRG